MKLLRAAVPLLLLLALTANAQEFRGKVQGTVTDKSEAVVVGAKVTLTNIATGVVSTAESSAAGHYIFNFVQPGAYTVSAAMQGFSRVVQENVTVPVSGDVTVNLTLAVGAVNESVSVTAAPADLKFDSATIDTVITESMVNALPQATRDPFALALLDPTITYNSAGGTLEPFMVWAPPACAWAGLLRAKATCW